MDQQNKLKIAALLVITVLAIASKLFITLPNFSPIGAVVLLGAAYFARTNTALLVPLGLMWLVDLYLNNVVYAEYFDSFQLLGVPAVYVSLVLIVLVGRYMLKKVNFINVLAASLMAAVTFFLITNFGSWLTDPVYPKNLGGLMQSYHAGIPFFRGTFFGNLFFTTFLFFAFEMFSLEFFTSAFSRKSSRSLG